MKLLKWWARLASQKCMRPTCFCNDFVITTFLESVQLYEMDQIRQWAPLFRTALRKQNACKRAQYFKSK